jgi:hypothetical protein
VVRYKAGTWSGLRRRATTSTSRQSVSADESSSATSETLSAAFQSRRFCAPSSPSDITILATRLSSLLTLWSHGIDSTSQYDTSILGNSYACLNHLAEARPKQLLQSRVQSGEQHVVAPCTRPPDLSWRNIIGSIIL